jgi:putative DNA primase/helicase
MTKFPSDSDDEPPEEERVVSISSRRRKEQGRPDDPRPLIRLNDDDLARNVNEAENALIKAELGLYQRNGKIVYVGNFAAFAGHSLKIVVQQICERDDHALRVDLATAARFEKFDARAKNFVACAPPLAIVKSLQALKDRLRFPVLSGVVNTPTMGANGSILDAPGYDDETGLVYDPMGVEFPPIPDRPTRADAVRSLATLNEIIKDFPFISEQHRSVAFSAILTAPMRRSLPTAPLHGFDAPAPGSGKSKLVDIVSVIATGHEAPVSGQGADDEELEKRLVAHLLSGDPIIAIDNCTRPLSGDFLNRILTQQSAKPRILGKSEAPTLLTNSLVAATGNNLKIKGDLTRRTIMCRLNPNVERPELRIFDRDPVAFAKANRPALVVAVLTILRAHHVAGSPGKPAPLGSFEVWSNLIRGALIWLGCADPVETMSEIREADPVIGNLRMVMSAWRENIRREQVTVSQVIKAATEQTRVDSYDGNIAFVNEDLREALLTVAGRGGVINSRALGNWLAAHQGRIVDGAHFAQFGTRQGVAVWALTDAE